MFSQGSVEWAGWKLTAGGSFSFLKTRISHQFPSPVAAFSRSYSAVFSPRLALLKALPVLHSSVYGSVSRGFSPPGSNEVLPSGSPLNTTLQPERGTNYEAGLHTEPMHQQLYLDFTLYAYKLSNAIAQRRDALGGSYFINSGGTLQQGLEIALRYLAVPTNVSGFSLELNASAALQHYRYQDFRQGSSDFSGNILPGTPPATLYAAGVVRYKTILQATASWMYNDVVQLNDANTAAAAAWSNLGFRLDATPALSKGWGFTFFVGADNMLDTRYTAAPDVNAFGGRYYNVAAGRNFFAGAGWKL